MKYLIANWKAYITEQKAARELAVAVGKERLPKWLETVLCPPFVFLPEVARAARKKRFAVGAQDMFFERVGAYTGATTLDMLKNFSVRFVIVGHSERRKYFAETDEIVNQKIKAALAGGFRAVLCVGEEAREEKGGVPESVAQQVMRALDGISVVHVKNILVAYEPIWAIGTGVADSPDDALSAALYIRKTVGKLYGKKAAFALPVLYGGSVNAENISDFTREDGIDGVLVGRASTNKKELIEILRRI